MLLFEDAAELLLDAAELLCEDWLELDLSGSRTEDTLLSTLDIISSCLAEQPAKIMTAARSITMVFILFSSFPYMGCI